MKVSAHGLLDTFTFEDAQIHNFKTFFCFNSPVCTVAYNRFNNQSSVSQKHFSENECLLCTTVNLFLSPFRENLLMNTKNEWEKQNTLRWILQIVKEAWGCSLTCEVRICCRISTTFPSKLKRHLNQFLLSGEIIVCFAPLLPKGPFHRFISICYVVGLNSTAQKITRCHVGFGEWIGIHQWSV